MKLPGRSKKILCIVKNYAYIGAILLILTWGIFKCRSNLARDYYQFWVVGQAIQSMNLNNIHSDEERKKIGEYFLSKAIQERASIHQIRVANIRKVIDPGATPFLYSMFYLFSTGKYDLDYEIFRIISSVSFFFSILLFCYMFKLPRLYTVVVIILFTQFFDPFRRDVLEGNVNQIELGIISLILYLRIKETKIQNNFIAGLLSGLLIMFKPNLFPIFIFLVLRNFILSQRLALFSYIAGIAIAIVLAFFPPFIILGKACTWFQWLTYLPKLALNEIYMKRSFLYIFFGVRNLIYYYLLAFLLILLPIILVAVPKLTKRPSLLINIHATRPENVLFTIDSLMIILGLSAYFLASTYVHLHYFVLIIPALILILIPSKKSDLSFRKEALMAIFWFAILFFMFNINTHREGYEGIGIYRTYWPFAYISIIFIYVYALIKLPSVFCFKCGILDRLKKSLK